VVRRALGPGLSGSPAISDAASAGVCMIADFWKADSGRRSGYPEVPWLQRVLGDLRMVTGASVSSMNRVTFPGFSL
jgi:hypothetical protein